MWDTAAREMLQVNGATLLELWGGCEEESGQTAFLDRMNTAKDKHFEFVVEVNIRDWKGKYSYQLGITAATEVESLGEWVDIGS